MAGRALEVLGQAVLLTDCSGRITWCNPSFCRLSGYTRDEARGRLPFDLFACDGADAERIAQMHRAIRLGTTFCGRILCRAKAGRVFSATFDLQPLATRDGKTEGCVITQTELTDGAGGADAPESLRVIDSAATGIIVQDAQGIVTVCNPEAERMLGVSAARFVGVDATAIPSRLCDLQGDLLGWDQHPATRTIRTGVEVAGGIYGVASAEGHRRWLQISCRITKGSLPGKGSVVSTFVDVTAQQTALSDLSAERWRLKATLEGTQAGVWEWNLQTGETHANERWAQIAGYSLAELQPLGQQTWVRLIHPDDVPAGKEALRRHAADEAEIFQAQYRIQHKDGRWIWVNVRGRIASRTADGGAEWMYGTHVDIDAAKRSELELKRANDKLQGLFDLSPLGITLNDLSDARYLEFNDALLAMTGYARHELVGVKHRDLCPPAYHAEVRRQHALLLSEGRFGPYETAIRHKNGHHIPVQVTGMRVALEDGSERIWSIIQDISPRKRLEKTLRHEARTDRLTGLPNRSLLMERLQASVLRARADAAKRFAMFFIDFDRFKLVNDTLGHGAGDQLLVLIAERLRKALRADDVFGSSGRRSGGNVVARLGGDEFVILLHDVQSATEAQQVARRLIDLFAVPYLVRQNEIHSSASIGIVLADSDCESADSLLRDADMAMYEAKRAGRSTYAFFDPSMLTRLTRAVRIEEALRHAVGRNELSLVYQPIVNLETGRVGSAEALLRWQHPELGQVSPTEFVPIAEESGLIVSIGEWLLRECCVQWKRWQAEGSDIAPRVISVNLSRVEMALGDRLLERVAAVLAELEMRPQHLQLEVTEREVMRDPAGARRLMEGFRAMGVLLAMDDFGTGASSLGCLREYPFDVIKIDKSFIDDLPARTDMLAVMHASVSLIENLGMVSVAEGIEHEVQVGILQSLGCRHGQGYFFSRPVAGDRLMGVLREQLGHSRGR